LASAIYEIVFAQSAFLHFTQLLFTKLQVPKMSSNEPERGRKVTGKGAKLLAELIARR